MEKLQNSEQFDWMLSNHDILIAYFSGTKCAVCSALKPKIDMLIGQQFPKVSIVEIETEKFPEIAARYNVFSIPVLLLFVEKREYLREARNVSLSDLSQKIEKIVNLFND